MLEYVALHFVISSLTLVISRWRRITCLQTTMRLQCVYRSTLDWIPGIVGWFQSWTPWVHTGFSITLYSYITSIYSLKIVEMFNIFFWTCRQVVFVLCRYAFSRQDGGQPLLLFVVELWLLLWFSEFSYPCFSFIR